MAPIRVTTADISQILDGNHRVGRDTVKVLTTDVFIAGSGPIGATYARTILESTRKLTVIMAEVGSQDDPIIGAHHKNNVKYQRDIDAFVHVIKGALQPVSVPPADSYMPTLSPASWSAPHLSRLLIPGYNPHQKPEQNLRKSAVTRTVGGMATHWSCITPKPHLEERVQNPIPSPEFDRLLDRAAALLRVKSDQYDISIRHRLVKKRLQETFSGRGVDNLPLAVTRNARNPEFVTWTGTDTIFDKYSTDPRFTLLAESRVTRLHSSSASSSTITCVVIRDMPTDDDIVVIAKAYVIACGAICTPQLLWNSSIRPEPLGKYLTEHSLAFCQVVLLKTLVDSIPDTPEFRDAVAEHRSKHRDDPVPIPFKDPEPQVIIPYRPTTPWFAQIHRDAFSYGDVGPKADPRVVVDLRFFGKGEIVKENRVTFGEGGVEDIYGMPQPTFYVTRSVNDAKRDQDMMQDMTNVANCLGGFLPGSYPQFMEPGLALHVTGTTRIGTDRETSVADPTSKVHGFTNLWVGGNGCIPDATTCNPTLTSIAIALKGAEALIRQISMMESPAASSEPTLELGSFNTQEVRSSGDQSPNSKVVQFAKHIDGPTSISVGICKLDIACGIRMDVWGNASDVKPTGFNIGFGCWDGTTLYEAGLNWLRLPKSVFRCGEFSTYSDHPWYWPQVYTSRRITFSPPFTTPPKVVVFLNAFDLGPGQDWRVITRATDIDETGFTIHIDTQPGSTLYSARAGWIAYPANHEGIHSDIGGLCPGNLGEHKNSWTVDFSTINFAKPPNVFIAFNMLDVGHAANLRLSTFVDSVSTTTMTAHIDSWGDTVLQGTGVSYICM